MKSKPAGKNARLRVSIQLKTTCKISGTFTKKEKHLRSPLSMALHPPLQMIISHNAQAALDNVDICSFTDS